MGESGSERLQLAFGAGVVIEVAASGRDRPRMDWCRTATAIEVSVGPVD